MTYDLLRRPARLALLLAAGATLAACDDNGTDPRGTPRDVEVVVNSVDNTLTLLSPDSNSAPVTVQLGSVAASPVGAAARGAFVIVPEGIYPFAKVVDVRTGTVVRTVELPANSGATGAAFLNDSIALVGNSNLNTVTAVNVLTGTTRPQVAVGTFPQAIVPGANGTAYVLNANLVNFAPAGPGSVSVINAAGQVTTTIPLTGINPAAGVVSGGRLYVINSGTFNGNNSSLSVVSLTALREERVVGGFGNFPGAIDVGPDGNVYVGIYDVGVVVWNPNTLQFVRSVGNPIVPGGSAPVSAVAFDANGKLHTLNPGNCDAPGKEYRLSGSTVERTATTGICPFSITFTSVPSVD